MRISRKSPFSQKVHTMDLPISEEEFERCNALWQSGTLIQNAFPMLNAEQREFLMTGITPREWADTFKKVQ